MDHQPRHLYQAQAGFPRDGVVVRPPCDRGGDLDEGQRRLMDGEPGTERGSQEPEGLGIGDVIRVPAATRTDASIVSN